MHLRSKLTVVSALVAAVAPLGLSPAPASAGSAHAALNCEYALCAEVANPDEVFGAGNYVGHDEPSTIFYSNQKGAGSNVRYQMKLPTDPSPNNPSTPGKSYQFMLNGAFWFGMALCDTQSYPEQLSTCTPSSDTNIVDPAVSPKHPGTAFVEVQFYPPGWVSWPTFQQTIGAGSCDPVKWCAAVNIFQLLQNPVTGQLLNAACQGQVGGIEPVNFAFITLNGKPHAAPNPLDSTVDTFTPHASTDLFMNSGDELSVAMRDSAHGLKVTINDKTTEQSGSMIASGANGFKQVNFAPASGCTATPYDFHPMYSTSSEQTRVIWAAHTYNIGFSSEIGHFQFCTGDTPVPSTTFGAPCPAGNFEGDNEPTDGDENAASPSGPACFPASRSSLVQIAGCTDQNNGFDGVDYQPVWPDGNTALHPTSVLFSSPTTGEEHETQFSRVAFEADLPRIEANTCNRSTGAGCTLIPTTDDNAPANFYPYFSTNSGGAEDHQCRWQFGGAIPGSNLFGQNAQYGTLLTSAYLLNGGGGSTVNRINNFRGILANPCKGGDN
jgi:hypothetical protein